MANGRLVRTPVNAPAATATAARRGGAPGCGGSALRERGEAMGDVGPALLGVAAVDDESVARTAVRGESGAVGNARPVPRAARPGAARAGPPRPLPRAPRALHI